MENWQEKYIEENAGKLRGEDIAQAIGLNQSTVYRYCKEKKLKLMKSYDLNSRTNITVKKQSSVARHPAKYDNKSREERINELLAEGTGHD